MLLVIHNLPSDITYEEIKFLLKSKCGLTEVLLDNLVNKGLTKRVTVGLADEDDAAVVVRKISGLYVGDLQLYVEDVRKKKVSEQPFIPSESLVQQPSNYEPKKQTNQRDTLGNRSMQGPNAGYQPSVTGQDQMTMIMIRNMAMAGICNMPQMPIAPSNLNSYMGFNDQSRQIPSLMPQVPEVRDRQEPFRYRSGVDENGLRDWSSDNNGPDNRQRQRSPARGQSPDPFEGRMSRRDEPQFEPQHALRHSRSPMRDNWGLRDRFDNCAPAVNPAYAKFYNDAMPVGKNSSSQNYDEQRTFGHSERFPSNADSMQSNVFGDCVEFPVKFYSDTKLVGRNNSFQNSHEQTTFGRAEHIFSNADSMQPSIFGDHVTKFSVNNPVYRQDQPRNNRDLLNVPGTFQPGKRRKDNAQTSAQNCVQNKWENEPKPKRFAAIKPQKTDAPNGRNRRAQEQRKFKSQGQPNLSQQPAAAGSTTKPFKKASENKNPITTTPSPTLIKDKKASENKNPITTTPSPTLIKDDNYWRGAATNSIARKFVNDIQTNIQPFYGIFAYLKKNIRSRIDVILGDNISKNKEDIIERYRSQFPNSGDRKFFNDVVQEYKQSQEYVLKKAERELTPELKEALEEETNIMCDVFMSECLNPDNEQDNYICEQIADVVSDEFRQVIAEQITEQLLRRKQHNLVVRAICVENKPVQLKEFFMREYGAVSCKNAARSRLEFVVCFDTYANYERLLKTATVKIGDAAVNFRPYQDLQPFISARLEQKRKRTQLENLEDNCSESLLEPGYTCYPTVDPQTYNVGDHEDGPNDEVQENEPSAEVQEYEDYEEVDDEDEAGRQDHEEIDLDEDKLDSDDLEDY